MVFETKFAGTHGKYEESLRGLKAWQKEVLRHRGRTDKAPLLVANLVIKISTIALRIELK